MVSVLRGGFSRVEQTVLEGGSGSTVIQGRMEFEDMICGLFGLAPIDLVDRDEITVCRNPSSPE